MTNVDGTGGNDDLWKGTAAGKATDASLFDNSGWTIENAYGGNQCIRLSTTKKLGSATTPELNLSGDATLTFRAGAWNAKNEKTTINVTIEGGTLDQTSVELTKGAFTEYTLHITGGTAGAKITFAASDASNNRFFLDDVKVVGTGTVTPSKKNADLAWSEENISIEQGEAFTAPAFTKATTATVTFASDNEAVATVDANGKISLAGGEGKATITATAEANDAFEAGTASVTITVFTNNVYKKVTTVTSGAQYLLVAQRDEATYYAYPITADYTYGYLKTGKIDGTVDEIKVKSTYNDAFTFESMDGGYSIKDALGRYYIQQGTYKSFNTAETPAAWTVEPQEDGTFKIAQNGYYMQFGQGTYTSFGVYTDAQDNTVLPLLYAHVVTIPAIATAEGYATYYTDKAFIMPEGLEGTTISYDAAANSLKMEWQYKAGTTVPAGTALLVKGTKGQSYDALVVSSDAKAPADNVLYGATKATTPEEAGKYYELTYSKEGDKAVLGFFYENENGDAFESAAGKAYLRLPEGVSAAAAKGFALDGNVTGIEGVTNATATTPAAIYSLDGRRLTAPVKGINIIGGKKVLVK